MTNRIRILIVDDHPIVREGIRTLLEAESDLAVVGEAEDGADAIAQARALLPQVVIMDLVMPGMDGVEATRRIRAALPQTQVLVFTEFGSHEQVLSAIRAGAGGYLLKDSQPSQLLDAIRQVARGEPSLEPSIASQILAEISQEHEPRSLDEPLSDRETEVLRLLAQGLSNLEIAERLSITEMTVRSHVSNILSKLHLASRVQAALYALREGLVSLADAPPDRQDNGS